MPGIFSTQIDDDSTDRVNHFFTSLLIFICVIVSSKRQYIGSPISCWAPKEFKPAHIEYAENICWVQNTYFMAEEAEIPIKLRKREDAQLGYYQWVPFVLMIQAIIFQIPNFIWGVFYTRSSIRVRQIVESACESENLNPHTRKKTVRVIARHLEQSLDLQREYRETCCVKVKACLVRYAPLWCSKKLGNFLCTLYTFIKLLYIGNVIGQLYLMNSFLGGTSSMYGFEVAWNMTQGLYWEQSGNFPRVTLCDFEIRVLGNLHRHSLQCVLPINRLNEKIYVVLWFWFVGVGLLTVYSLVHWSMRNFCRGMRIDSVRDLLNYSGALQASNSDNTEHMVEKFTDYYLRHDGVFMLRLLQHNAGKLIASEIAVRLWHKYARNRRAEKNNLAKANASPATVRRLISATGSENGTLPRVQPGGAAAAKAAMAAATLPLQLPGRRSGPPSSGRTATDTPPMAQSYSGWSSRDKWDDSESAVSDVV